MDLAQLAQIAKPQLPPGLTVTPNMGAAHGAQTAQYENFLAMASQQAQQEAAAKASDAEERSITRPDRLAKSQLEGETSRIKLEDLRKNGRQDIIANRLKQELTGLEQLMAALDKTTSDEEAQAALDTYMGDTMVGGKDLRNEPIDKVRKMAKWYMAGGVNSVKHKQKMEELGTKEAGALERAKIAAGSRERVAGIRAQIAKLAAEAKAMSASGKPPTESQLKAKIIQGLIDSGRMTDEMVVQMWHDEKVQAKPADVAKAETAKNIGLPAEVPTTQPIPFKEPTQQPSPKPQNTKPTKGAIDLPKDKTKLVIGQDYKVPGEKNLFKWDGTNLVEQ